MIEIKIFNQKTVVDGTKSDVVSKKTSWILVSNPKNSEWDQLSSYTNISVSELRNFLRFSERPILRDIGGYTAVTFRAPFLSGKGIVTKPSLFLVSEQKRQFFSVGTSMLTATETLMTRSDGQLQILFSEGPTALLYGVLDEIVAVYHQMLDHMNDEVERIESAVLRSEYNRNLTGKIFELRKTLVFVVRALIANQEVISAIEKDHGKYLKSSYEPKFRTLYEDMEQLEDLASMYRELLSSSLDVHLSEVSNNLNIIMKRLTSWAAIILIPTLIAGIYGMNFKELPLADHPAGFFITLGIMALSVSTLFFYFSKKDWM